MSNSLALFGGEPSIRRSFPKFNSFDQQEEEVVLRVLRSGNLSSYLGAPGENFYGGKEVLKFEEAFSAKFQVIHSISVNSWTSGLWAIMGALDLEPGSEVLVSSWTMAATATTILHWGLIPVFVDINPKTFNIDFDDVVSKTSDKTKAIVSPDIFGLSADNLKLRKWCDSRGIYLVSDSAQSPLATDEFGNLTSTLSHIGGFSLNYHKHIHTGEGGVVVTSDSTLAERVRMLRNHGEVAVEFGTDLQLSSVSDAPGKSGSYPLILQVELTNIFSVNITPTLYVVVVNEGTFTIDKLGSAVINSGELTSTDILDAKTNEQYSYYDFKDLGGGSWFDGLKKGFLMPFNWIKKGVEVAKPIKDAMGLVGMGVHSGGSTASYSDLKDRLAVYN